MLVYVLQAKNRNIAVRWFYREKASSLVSLKDHPSPDIEIAI